MTMSISGVNSTETNLIWAYGAKVNPSAQQTGSTNQQTTFGESDSYVKTDVEKPVCPKISKLRAAFSFLTNEQIKAINAAGELPKGTKFMKVVGGYAIGHNYFGLRTGTQIMPAGYEMKKNIFGQAIVVPIGTKGLFVKDVK